MSATTALSATLGKAGNDDPSGKNGTQAMSFGHTDVEHLLLRAVEQAVGVLHADDARRQRALQHLEWHVADPDRADLAFVAQRDHLGQLVVEVDDLVALGRETGPQVETPQIHHRDAVEPELA